MAHRFPSKQHDSLDDSVAKFIGKHRLSLDRVCFAIAGPVSQGRVATTNVAWVVDASRLAKLLGLDKVTLLNDLEAIGYGLAELRPEDVAVVNPGAPVAAGNMGMIPAGTGLGPAGC